MDQPMDQQSGYSKDELDHLVNEALDALDSSSKDIDAPTGKDVDDARAEAMAELTALKEERLEFPAHINKRYRLDTEELTKQRTAGAELAPLVAEFDFYYVYFPVTVLAKRDYGFTKLDAQIELQPELDRGDRTASFYAIFPKSDFHDFLKGEAETTISLDANFKFNAQGKAAIPANPVGSVGGEGAATSEGVSHNKVTLNPGPLLVRIPLIVAAGEGNETASWQINTSDVILGNDELRLAGVVQVPKGTTQVSARGILRGYHNLTGLAKLRRFFFDNVFSAFKEDKPLVANVTWKNILPPAATSTPTGGH